MEQNYITLLKSILAASGLSQRKLAQRLGVTYAALNRWLNQHAVPHPSKLETIHGLYKEMVGYPSITPTRLRQAILKTDKLKKKNFWGFIARSESLQEELILEHTYNSTAIEGTTFTKNQTKAVIFDKSVIRGKSLKEHLEVTNHAAVLREILQKKITAPLTEELIKEIHKKLMLSLREDAGEYAKHQRVIHGSNIALTHPKDIPEEMKNLIAAWNKKRIKAIREIGDFHVHFELIHPFGDGNGRIGRLLMALQCLKAGYPPVVIENSRKAEYYDVLEYAQKKSDEPFILFLAEEMNATNAILKRHSR